MKNGFCFKDLNFEGKAGFALSLLATSLAQQVTAADVFKSELPQHKAVTYNVDSRGSLSTSVTNKWTQSLAANTTLASTTSVAPRGKMSINKRSDTIQKQQINNPRTPPSHIPELVIEKMNLHRAPQSFSETQSPSL